MFFEGYFVVNHTRMAPAQDFFGQLWKEYSLSDSRYLTSDPFVLCMETITAVCLPLSLLIYWGCTSSRTDRLAMTDSLGTPLLHRRLFYCARTSTPSPPSTNRINWPNLWRRPLLCYEHVRPLLQWIKLLQTRGVLFLVLLLFHELDLDRDPFL